MTTVISPWVFYWMPVCDNLIFTFTTIWLLGLIVIGFLGFLLSVEAFYDDTQQQVKRLVILLIIITMVSLLISIFIPSEETITKMIIAQNVTFDSVEAVSDTVATVYNDIMDLFRNGE